MILKQVKKNGFSITHSSSPSLYPPSSFLLLSLSSFSKTFPFSLHLPLSDFLCLLNNKS